MNTVSNFNSNEICRMSWFLIEMDEGLSKGRPANGKRLYCIIHSVDLIDGDSSNMYINRIVKFNRNHAIVQGKVVLASDDRLFVERQMKQLTLNAEDAILLPENDRRFLVQYSKGAYSVVHAIIHQKEICWPQGDLSNQREVLVRDGKIQRLATVLYSHESDEKVQNELQKLKTSCFESAFDDNDVEISMDGDPWLLVQYSCSPTNVVYTIISYRETVWQEENLYKDVVAYITDGTSIYQSVIIRKSHNRNELDYEINNIKSSCLVSRYPLEFLNDAKFTKAKVSCF